jgi:hypothetical protein
MENKIVFYCIEIPIMAGWWDTYFGKLTIEEIREYLTSIGWIKITDKMRARNPNDPMYTDYDYERAGQFCRVSKVTVTYKPLDHTVQDLKNLVETSKEKIDIDNCPETSE